MKSLKLQSSDWLMLVVAVIWGINFPLIKIALREIPPVPFNALRLLLAASVLTAFLIPIEGNLKIQKKHLPKMIMLAFSGYTVYQFLFIYGLAHTTSSNTAVLYGLVPILAALLSVFLKHEKIKRLGWFGISLGFIGIYLVISGQFGGISFSDKTLKGDLCILGAVILWAHYSVSAAPLLKIYSPLKFTTFTMLLGSLFFFPFAVGEILELDFSGISWGAWSLLAFTGVMALSVSLVIWFFSVRRVGNSLTAVYGNLPVVLAVIFSWLILSETIHLSLIIGGAVVLLGIVFTHLGRGT